MKCPFTGKPCLLPKEIPLSEMKDGKIVNLYLCRDCGIEHLAKTHPEIHTKPVNIITASGEIRSLEEPLDAPMDFIATEDAVYLPGVQEQILSAQEDLQYAVENELYEEAADLRDRIKELRSGVDESQQSPSDQE